ncbi:unnamed protein product [Coregonus sp. 'balchen']|nr:unnamed protein product [Coregonus sp. 'balchen']
MSERSGQTAKGKDGKSKYASLNLFDTYKGKSLEAQKPVVPPRHGLQSLGKVASARRMPPPASLPSLKAENKGNDPNVSLVPKDGTGWASKLEPADPKSTAAGIAAACGFTDACTDPPENPASSRGFASGSGPGFSPGRRGKVLGSGQCYTWSTRRWRLATRTKLAENRALQISDMTSWRDGGGRALAPTGEGVAEGGPGGALVMEGAAVGGQAGPPLQQQQNPQSHGPPRNPPAGSPMYPPYLPFPPPYGPQGPYGYPPPGEAPPRFRQQGQDSRGRPQGVPRGGGGEMVKRPSILKQDDLKELDELDHQDGDEGWAGAHEEIDYSAKLKFSDDEGEEEGDEERNERPERSERSESKNGPREIQRSQEGPLHVAQRSRASDSGGDRDTSRTPLSNADHDGPPPPSSKPGWAEEGCNSGPATYQFLLTQDRNSPNQSGPVVAPGTVSASLAPGKPTPSPQLQQQQATSPVPGGPTPPPQTAGLLAPPPGEDEDETWRQRRKQSSSEISAAVERARRRREEEERRMEEERRAACAEKLKRLDEKAQQQGGGGGSSGGSKPPSLDGNSATAGSPSPSLSASASSPNISQPPSPCVDHDEPPLAAQAMCPQPPTPLLQQPPLEVLVPGEGKEEILGSAHVRGGGVVDPMKVEGMAGGAGPLQYTPQGSMGRGPLPMNFDPRWMMMPYMDPRMMQGGMQGRPPGPMDYYPPNMQHAGMMGRERSDSGGSGSDNFDRQQHPGHPHSGTPPIDTKLAWGPEVFPGGSEGRGLSSPLRQKQALEEDDVSGKGTRSDTPPVRGMREGGPGPIQQPGSGSSNQTPAPVGTQVVGHGGGSHHHQSYMGGRGNYINFPDQGSRMAPHQQQQQRGSDGGFSHQDEGQGHKGGQQQGQIWGGPRPQYDRNGRTDLSLLENNNPHHPQHHGHQQHQAPSHFPLHLHKPENGRSERGGEAPKKGDPSTPLQQPSLSSCSSSSSSSSAREDGSGKVVLHHFPPQREADTGTVQRNEAGSGREMKQDKMGPGHSHSQSSVTSQQSHPQSQQQRQGQEQQHHRDPKPNQRERGGREHKTETQWGPRPGSSNAGGPSSHNRRAVGGNSRGGEDSSNHPTASDHNKPAGSQSGGGNTNKRAGPIKRPVLKREGGEGERGEKTSGGGFGKDERQDGGHSSVKQEASSGPQSSSAVSGKEEPAQTGPKPRNGGKDRAVNERGGVGKGPKNGVNPTPSSGYSGPPSNRRDRERSFERGGGASYHGVPARGSRVSRGRGGEFYGRGRGYRGTYTGMAGGGSVGRGRAASSRSSRDYRSGGGYDEASGGRRGRGGSQANPGRARNHSETRSEGSEYEEVPKRRRQRGSETGSESAASDLAQSDKEDRKSSTKNGSGTYNVTGSGSAPPRGSQARVFTPRGVPSRRGRGGGGGGGGIYRSGGGGMAGGHRSGSRADPHGWASKSSASVRKQQAPMQSAAPKDTGRGTSGEKEKAADGSRAQNQGGATPPQSIPAAPTSAPQGSMENGGVGIQQSTANPTTNSSGPLPLPLSGPDGRDFPCVPRDGFERPPRRRRHGRSQHQQDKPPRFRRLKERENAARINGGVGVIGGGRPSSPGQNYVQDVTDGAPNAAPTTGGAPNANPNVTTATNNSTGGHLGSANANSHHHHHYNQGISGQSHSQHHHNPAGGAKSPDFSNQNSDQANEEWETASESSDFTEFREREGGGGKSYSSHHHHHPHGRGGGGGGVVGEREMKAKEQAANKRSFSSQRPGMERQNRRVNAGGREGREGGGGRGPRGPPGGGGAGNGGGQRGERRGNWPSPKNRK